MRHFFLLLFLVFQWSLSAQQMVVVPGGTYLMGDHQGLGGAEHRNDEIPIHSVSVDTFSIARFETTNSRFAEFLNESYTANRIEVRNGYVYYSGKRDTLFEVFPNKEYSRIEYDGTQFKVRNSRGEHPVTGVRWYGAAAFCNWLSAKEGIPACYDETTWECDYTRKGYRLPTEAEWEYAGRGGKKDPYCIMPWGDDYDNLKGNFEASGDPFETGDYPWTTPVGFYDGSLRRKADFGWPDPRDTWQTHEGTNGYGLADMAGNVWEWVNDWYGREYYAVSPSSNPKGPTVNEASPMPDGKPYHVLRGGNWYNGKDFYGHARVSNRNPGYYRGPQDPSHPYYHIGFRVARSGSLLSSSGDSQVFGNANLLELSIYPVPANGAVTLAWNMIQAERIRLDVVSVTGTLIRRIHDEIMLPGRCEILLNETGTIHELPPGIYEAILTAGNRIFYRKFIIL